MSFTLVEKLIVLEINWLLVALKLHDDIITIWWWYHAIMMILWYDDDIMVWWRYDDMMIWRYDDDMRHDDDDIMILGRVTEIRRILFQQSIENWPLSH